MIYSKEWSLKKLIESEEIILWIISEFMNWDNMTMLTSSP